MSPKAFGTRLRQRRPPPDAPESIDSPHQHLHRGRCRRQCRLVRLLFKPVPHGSPLIPFPSFSLSVLNAWPARGLPRYVPSCGGASAALRFLPAMPRSFRGSAPSEGGKTRHAPLSGHPCGDPSPHRPAGPCCGPSPAAWISRDLAVRAPSARQASGTFRCRRSRRAVGSPRGVVISLGIPVRDRWPQPAAPSHREAQSSARTAVSEPRRRGLARPIRPGGTGLPSHIPARAVYLARMARLRFANDGVAAEPTRQDNRLLYM
jgi:hypothetical protein